MNTILLAALIIYLLAGISLALTKIEDMTEMKGVIMFFIYMFFWLPYMAVLFFVEGLSE